VTGNEQKNSISHSFVVCWNQRLYNGFPWNCTLGIKVSHDLSDDRPDSFWHRAVSFFCFPNQGERILFNIILLNLSMVFLSISGLISYPQAEEFLRVTGILCFSLGLLINAVCNAFLVLWIISETSYGKQDSNNKLFDEYLDAIIQAKLLKYRNKIRND